jgi:hypothetical protein
MAKQTYETYFKEYFNTKCKRINLILDNEKDADIIKALEGKNVSKTIREFIRKGLQT